MGTTLADLPDDIQELIAPHLAPSPETLDAIGIAIAQKRDEAKSARTSSGIEQTWRECEEAYVGIDDANRGEFQDKAWAKPMSMDGPVTTGKTSKMPDYKSTAFVRLTARYVDAGAAKLGEILLPIDDKAFSFSETPVPELIKAKDDNSQVVHDGLGNAPLMRPAKPGEVPPAGLSPPPLIGAPIPPGPGTAAVSPSPAGPAMGAAPAGGAVLPAGAAAPPQVPLTVKDLALENIELARKKAKAAETRIYDWMVECQYPAETRKVIFDSARIGVGVLKGPFPKPSRGIAVSKTKGEGVDIQIVDRLKPAAKWIDPWNVFPDMACGENIRDGDFIFERDYLAERQVRNLKKVTGYIEAQIDKVLLEGPDKINTREGAGTVNGSDAARKKNRYEIWYYYGTLTRDEMDCICRATKGVPLSEAEAAKDKKEVYAIVTVINDCVVRATINPLDSGELPYHSVPWQRRAGHWAGIGVAEQIATPQKMLNAANRAMLNNAGKSSGSQFIINRGAIVPADGSWIVTPDKIWYTTEDGIQDVRMGFMSVDIPNKTKELLEIVQFAMQIAEESTSIPLVTQGQSGKTTPDTFGATQLQDNNANQLLRSIGYAFDDNLTEPVVRQFYEWLLLDPEVPDEEKGEFNINAHGSAALVERAIQDQAIAQMGALVGNPIFGADPKKWFKLMAKSKRLDPAEISYTEEEQAKIDAQPPSVAPAVQVAQINADTEMRKIAAAQPAQQRTMDNEVAIAASAQALEGKKVEAEHDQALTAATVKLHEIQERKNIALLDYANRRGISLDRAKADLAKTAMTLDAQRELNAADNAIELHKHHNPQPERQAKPSRRQPAKPLAQVPGRSPNGHAFDQGTAT